jgi:chromosome segregation ATPase
LTQLQQVATRIKYVENRRRLAKERLAQLDGNLETLRAVRRERVKERGEVAHAGLLHGVPVRAMQEAMRLKRTQSVYIAAERRSEESKPELPKDFEPLADFPGPDATSGQDPIALGEEQIIDALGRAADALDDVQREIDTAQRGKKRTNERLVEIRAELADLRKQRSSLGKQARAGGATYISIAVAAGKKSAGEGHDIVSK